MGGLGSGNQWKSGKPVTMNYRALDVRRLNRDGLLWAGHSFVWTWSSNGKLISSINIRSEEQWLVLNYINRSAGDDWEKMEYTVGLDYTDCHLGGQRPWFLCPARGCGRRVAILYAGTIFACRHCHKLVYQSQRELKGDRAMRMADGIRRKLGWEPGILNRNGGKPKRMRWKTFFRMLAKHDALVDQSLAHVVRRLDL